MFRPQLIHRPSRSTGVRLGQRRAFSLIELMVVIVIIGILAGFLLPGVMGAKRSVQVAAVVTEFKNFEKAIGDFKLKYGMEPPSGIRLYETPADWNLPAARPSRGLVRKIWPEFDFSLARDINGDGDTGDTLTLNGAECLVFFLGGVNSTQIVNRQGALVGTAGAQITEWGPQGFSVNPANPFARGGSRVGPFIEFDIARLMNFSNSLSGQGMPEYRDNLPGQRSPLIYGSSYEGKGYRNEDFLINSAAVHDYDEYATTPPNAFTWYYRRYTGSTFPVPNPPPPAPPTPPPLAFDNLEPFNPRSYQLISPGFDGEYGLGGVLNNDMEINEPIPVSAPGSNQARALERDNITNFKGSAFE